MKSLMNGEAETKTAAKLAERFDVSEFHATTLVRTETSHIHTRANLQTYEDLGIKKYKYLAALDYRTCELCQPLDGMSFEVSEAREGVNCPVMHPRCRCTITADMEYTTRRARDPLTGRNTVIDGSVTYKQWYESLSAEQKAALETARKKDSNKTKDMLQHTKYQNVLGKEVPRSFDKWQELKYNNKERYAFMKLDYRRQNKLLNDPLLELPNADKATADNRKFTEYLFGGTNKNGLSKGNAFTSRLGYDIDNYTELKKEILSRAVKYPATLKNSDIHGNGYEQKIILYGKKDMPANVIVGWKTKNGETWMTSAYIKEVKK